MNLNCDWSLTTNRVKEKIEQSCLKGKKYSFTVYNKKYRYEISPSGSGIKTITIDTNNFDKNPELVFKEVLDIRYKNRLSNRSYIPPTDYKNKYVANETVMNIENKTTSDNKISDNKTSDNKTSDNSEIPTYVSVGLEKMIKSLSDYNIEQLNYIDVFQPKTGASSCAILGSGQTGKSNAMMHMYDRYYNNNKWISILYSLSDHIKIYQNRKYLLIRPAFNKKDADMIELQKYINSHTDNHYLFMNMFDDIVDAKYSTVVNKLILVYRNSMISTIISTQYLYLISRQNRTNINSFLFFRFHNMEYLQDIINQYLKNYFIKILGIKTTMNDMVNFYQLATSDYGCIYIIPCKNHISFHRLSLNK